MDLKTLSIYSYDGNSINDLVNYKSGIMVEIPPLEDTEISSVSRADEAPMFSAKTRNGKILQLQIFIIDGSLGELSQWFDPRSSEEKTLIAKDSENGDKQWYLKGVVRDIPSAIHRDFRVNLYIADYVWRSVSAITDSLEVTVSGDTLELTNSGNAETDLNFEITPTSLKSGSYYRYRYPVRVYHEVDSNLANRAIMILMDTASEVEDTTVSNDINQVGGIGAGDLSIPIDTPVGGGLDVNGGMCYVDTEQIRYDSISGGVITVNAAGRGWGGTTAAAHADDATISQSRMRADGLDLRVFEKSQELDRWLNDMNTASTEIWTQGLNFSSAKEMTLGAAIAGSGSVTSITLEATEANRTTLSKIPSTGGLIEVVTSGVPEIFVYTGYDLHEITIDIESREQRGTSMNAHSIGDTVRWLQHDLFVYSGYEEAEAPVVDTTKKPACELNSSNSSLVFLDFGDPARKRPFSWRGSMIGRKTKGSFLYQGNHGTKVANPITNPGGVIKAWLRRKIWKAGDGTIVWAFSDPGGITSVESSGEQYRHKGDYPETVGLEKSVNGTEWEEQWYEDSPTVVQTWESWTRTSSGDKTLGAGYEHVRFIFDGGCAGVSKNKVFFEVDNATVVLTTPVQVSIGSREEMYDLGCILRLQETGDELLLSWPMLVDDVLYVNSDERTILDSSGVNAYRAKSLNTKRIHWLTLPPGTFTLEYIEPGATGITVDVSYEERNL